MKKYNREKGRKGEEIAEDFLKKKGYRVLERNWGMKWGEIDLICRDREVLVFVEVKMKVGNQFGEPEEMVNKRKLGQIERMAGMYRSEMEQRRIDVVAIVLGDNGEVERVSHYEGVGL